MGSKPGAKMMVLRGDDGVYAITVKGNAKEKFEFNDDSLGQQFLQSINPDLSRMLRGNKKIENNSYKFEAGD